MSKGKRKSYGSSYGPAKPGKGGGKRKGKAPARGGHRR